MVSLGIGEYEPPYVSVVWIMQSLLNSVLSFQVLYTDITQYKHDRLVLRLLSQLKTGFIEPKGIFSLIN